VKVTMRSDRALVTVGQAARQLGVAPTTIQRWVDQGALSAERTVGGHRRIPLPEIRRLLSAQRAVPAQSSLGIWVDTLLTGDAYAVRAALLAAQRGHGNWATTADEVASAVAEIGRQWQAGLCAIFEEHGASEALRRAAAACAESIPRHNAAPRAALFTVEGERHTLGLSLAELVLAETGWQVLWLGEGPPAVELAALMVKREPDLLVVAASPVSARGTIAAYQSALVEVANSGRAGLVLGGAGAWLPSRSAQRAVSFEELRGVSDCLWTRIGERNEG
jgi:excisionase family DNA binding protein